MEWYINKTVNFKYKGGRSVKGKILYFDSKIVKVLLDSDYIGKNDEWFKGEVKTFNFKEIKGNKSIEFIK